MISCIIGVGGYIRLLKRGLGSYDILGESHDCYMVKWQLHRLLVMTRDVSYCTAVLQCIVSSSYGGVMYVHDESRSIAASYSANLPSNGMPKLIHSSLACLFDFAVVSRLTRQPDIILDGYNE